MSAIIQAVINGPTSEPAITTGPQNVGTIGGTAMISAQVAYPRPVQSFDFQLLTSPPPPNTQRPVAGGDYTPAAIIALLNPHYCVGVTDHDTAIYRIGPDGSLVFVKPEDFKLHLANMFVEVTINGRNRRIPAAKYWIESSFRHQKRMVFHPGGTTQPGEHNLWRGFAIDPKKGWQKQRRLLRHLREIVCRRDKAKFKYLLRWLAWAVQNPDKAAGVVIVLQSSTQGTGKSTVGIVMLKIFGKHGALVDDKERLLGRFNDWLETISFVLCEEVLFAGDPKTTDKLKSLITAETIPTERKFGSVRQIQNRLHGLLTTNHDHAVAAGVRDRRNVVLDVSDERVGDKNWFDCLYRDLDDGGTSEFLYLLKNLRLGDWHPREILKTTETIEQQRMSGDSISQWSQACINADGIVGDPQRGVTLDLGQRTSSQVLRETYGGYCGQHRLRPVNEELFGKACTKMFGPRVRVTLAGAKRRPWGYDVPDGSKWQDNLDARLGIT